LRDALPVPGPLKDSRSFKYPMVPPWFGFRNKQSLPLTVFLSGF
jgi:hypothetical protein